MMNIELRAMFLMAGVPEADVDEALSYFLNSGRAVPLASIAKYRTARATYAAVDSFLDPEDINSPVARYVIQLGLQLTEWEKVHPGSTCGRVPGDIRFYDPPNRRARDRAAVVSWRPLFRQHARPSDEE